MKKKLVILVVLLFVAALALMMACSSNKQPANENNNKANNSSEETKEPSVPAGPSGTIYIATTDFSYESTDPIFYESLWGFAMYDPLITFDENGNFMGMVAESWELSEDGNTWTF